MLSSRHVFEILNSENFISRSNRTFMLCRASLLLPHTRLLSAVLSLGQAELFFVVPIQIYRARLLLWSSWTRTWAVLFHSWCSCSVCVPRAKVPRHAQRREFSILKRYIYSILTLVYRISFRNYFLFIVFFFLLQLLVYLPLLLLTGTITLQQLKEKLTIRFYIFFK